MDTTKARDNILRRIRSLQRRPDSLKDGERAAVAEYLERHPPGPRPALPADLKQHFRAMAERMASTVDEVARLTDAPAAAARYLAANQLAPAAVAWPALDDLDWAGAGLAVEFRAPKRGPAQGADAVGITGCYCALAETGTLVLRSGPRTHASTHLLPETHIALLPASRIVADMDAAFALMRSELGGAEAMMPRALNMVSGPSRTGDIEQTIVLGAHGPFRVHVIVAVDE
ncbi:MAG: lactate utilization protein C [Burkholderiales bacterium]|jgi:L-lactate dehydrogenase complex protein LldG|nr:lactate utilization protein C [Burkholderiales bacterium]